MTQRRPKATGRTETRWILRTAALILVGASICGLTACRSGNAATSVRAPHSSMVNQNLTLDPALFKGDVRQAYAVARKDPALLAQLSCYCGCEKDEGHKNLLDCFRTAHGSTCEICVGEALKAAQLANQGTPVEQIRDALRAEYGRGG